VAPRGITITLVLDIKNIYNITNLGLIGRRFTRYIIVVPINEILLTY
jgi:hypothetical protein